MDKNAFLQKVTLVLVVILYLLVLGLTGLVLFQIYRANISSTDKGLTATDYGPRLDKLEGDLTLLQLNQGIEPTSAQGSVTLSDELLNQIRDAIPKGDQGAQGEKGDQGPAGTNALVTQIQRFYSSTDIGPNSSGSAPATCEPGWTLLAGGCRIQSYLPPANVSITQTYPAGNTWFCAADNLDPVQSINLQGAVICYK